MSLKNTLAFRKIQKEQKKSPTVQKLNEFYSECKTFSYRFKHKRWIDFYDIETVFKYMLMDKELSDFTTEIMIRLQLNIESYQKKVNSKHTPLKALKIIVDVARKSIVI